MWLQLLFKYWTVLVLIIYKRFYIEMNSHSVCVSSGVETVRVTVHVQWGYMNH